MKYEDSLDSVCLLALGEVEDILKSKNVSVCPIDVVHRKGQLNVIEKEHTRMERLQSLESMETFWVLWINSKSIRVIDAKRVVFEKYKRIITSRDILMHHTLDDFEEIRKASAIHKLKCLREKVMFISDVLGNIDHFDFLQRIAFETITWETIREICFSLNKNFVMTARNENLFYEQLLEDASKKIGSMICLKMLSHFEDTLIANKQISRSMFDHFQNQFEEISTLMVQSVAPIFMKLTDEVIVIPFRNIKRKEWIWIVAVQMFDTFCRKRQFILEEAGLLFNQSTCVFKKMSIDITALMKHIVIPDPRKLVKERERQEVIPDRKSIYNKYPSILKHIAGEKNGQNVVKVFLRKEDKKAEKYFKERCCLENASFEFINTSEKRRQQEHLSHDQMSKTDASCNGKNLRKILCKVIQKHEDHLIANYSNLSGIGVGEQILDGEWFGYPCIVLYCFDKSLVPFGERLLPKYIEGYQVATREDFYVFGCSKNCQSVTSGCSIGRLDCDSSGSVGFLVKNSPLSEEGFLTAAHVALDDECCTSLYNETDLLSKKFPKVTQEIVHPSLEDSAMNNVIGRVMEAFYGNDQRGIDAAFVAVPSIKISETQRIQIAENEDIEPGKTIVTKIGRSTGETMGKLIHDYFTVVLTDHTLAFNVFASLKGCYIIENIQDHSIFFAERDSGSGVYLKDDEEKSKKALGIAIANSKLGGETAVCDIRHITDKFNVELYHA